jgi:hypothetical protein
MNKWFTLTVAALLSLALAEGEADVTFTITNVGFSAYIVTQVEGAEVEVAEVGANNAPWTLEVGKRYRIVNLAGTAHPLLLRSGQEVLLSQRGGGRFADDAEVAFERDDEGIAFTLTEALAKELDNYVCAFHPTMTGIIATGVEREVGAEGDEVEGGGYGGGGY